MRIVIGLLIGIWALSATAPADAAVVSGDRVNCRADARPNAKVIARLHRGERLEVLTTRNDWNLVDPPTTAACWVLSTFLATDGASFSAIPPSSMDRGRTLQGGYSRRIGGFFPHRHRHSSRSRSTGYDYGSGCPCSGSRICIGPRGGRYCITSGGNKRYGV